MADVLIGEGDLRSCLHVSQALSLLLLACFTSSESSPVQAQMNQRLLLNPTKELKHLKKLNRLSLRLQLM